MSVLVDLVLGVVTSIGGFVEAGSISTAAQAGSEFGFQLLWAIAGGTLMLALLVEMSGRLGAVSRQSVAAAVRERFGVHFQVIPLVAELAIDLLLLAAEIGGTALAVKLLTGIGFQWWVLPTGLAVWLVIWLCGFAPIEYGIGLLGLVTLSFVFAAWRLQPDVGRLGAGLAPSLPTHDLTRYGFLAVSILGATVSPYLLNFYASGAVEEQLTARELWVNRTTAYLGMCFGGVVSMGVLVTSALTLGSSQIRVDSYEQAALMFVPVFERWAVPLFALALGIGCFGAAVEIALNSGYLFAQVFGWSWGANRPRRDAARFSVVITLVVAAALTIALSGIDPLRLTLFSVALTVIVMPGVVLPFLVLMNDPKYVKSHTSGVVGNTFLVVLTLAAALMALVVVPLEILGG
jgi:Mn2+/Fe2+ NRAMP family transporter